MTPKFTRPTQLNEEEYDDSYSDQSLPESTIICFLISDRAADNSEKSPSVSSTTSNIRRSETRIPTRTRGQVLSVLDQRQK
jgi:hypothetical protein